MIRPNRIASFVLAALLFASGGLLAADKDADEKKAAQGIEGRVVKLKGNFMPGPGAGNRGGARTPLAVPVHVFKGKVEPFEKPDPDHEQLVKIVRADKKGRFKIGLEPGTYTVVAEIDGKMYLNLMQFVDGKSVWGSVTVKKGQWTTMSIEDTSEAAF